MIPYFEALKRHKRICPRCLKHQIELKPLATNPNGAVWRCAGCGWFQVIVAPKEAMVQPNIVKVDFEKRRWR